MFVSVGGRSLFEYGDVTHLSYLASVRKSVLAMLYGKYVENGTIRLETTLKDLQFTDVDGLLPRELEATVEHLITARSGVYHPASNAGDDTGSAPPRGSQQPGSYYLYNNWDFNAAGAVFEKLTGRDIYDALESDLARPIGMQDFDARAQEKTGDPKRSRHLAYHMFFSTRDMARIGLLMLRDGNWNGQQVVPRAWAQEIRAGRDAPERDEPAVRPGARYRDALGLWLHVVGLGRAELDGPVRGGVLGNGLGRAVHHGAARVGHGRGPQDRHEPGLSARTRPTAAIRDEPRVRRHPADADRRQAGVPIAP